MDRRSWLWRRKSSEKTPGETESSGSISSPSERFSDDQANLSHSTHSPEITSKAASNDGKTEKIKTLTEELSAARLSISAKEELAKQHAKVAEEAVTGWEKAEREVSSLKLQLDAALKKNSALEDRVGHLDGALKECVRQLRQAREEQGKKLEEAITQRSQKWESRKSELETELIELRSQLETAKSEAATSVDALRPKLDAAEKQNKALRLELAALSQKLEVRTLERDLSTQSAESASKQQLESIKKIAKLEAECRRLKCLTRKSSTHVDSSTDSQLDLWASAVTVELDQFKSENGFGRNLMPTSSEIVLMDDFLEMERLAALPDIGNRAISLELGAPSDKNDGEENPLKAELEAMIKRTVDLEYKIEKLEAEKLKLEVALDESQGRLEASQAQLRHAEEKSEELEISLSECQAELKTSQGQMKGKKTEMIRLQTQLGEFQDQLRTSQAKLNAAENELMKLQTQLIESEDQLKASEGHLKDAEAKSRELANQLREREDQLSTSQVQLKDLETNLAEIRMQLVEREEQLKASQARSEEAETELIKLKTQLYERGDQLKASQRRLEEAEMQLAKLKARLYECEDQLKQSQGEVKDTEARLIQMETQLNDFQGKLRTSEGQTRDANAKLVDLQTQLALTSKLKQVVEGELKVSNAKREKAELQMKALESETKSLLAKINSLVDEADKERALSAEVTAKCKRLENELAQRELEHHFPRAVSHKADKAEQEKELAVAAGKLADCQKTIASLGRQLKSLATLDDFLVESDNPLELSGESPVFFRAGQLVKMPSIDCQ